MAIWVVEQEAKVLAPFYHGERKQFSELNPSMQVFVTSVGIANAAGLGMVASSPYTYLWSKTTQARNYLAEEIMEMNYIRTGKSKFKPSYATKGGGFATRPLLGKYVKGKAGRRLAAKVGSRFIPYAGWALLMVDLWHVGKWIGQKTWDMRH